MACYRNSSVLMHAAVAATDAAKRAAAGHPLEAASLLLRRSVADSVAALIETAPAIRTKRSRGRVRRPWRRGMRVRIISSRPDGLPPMQPVSDITPRPAEAERRRTQ